MVYEITQAGFDEITGGAVMDEYTAIMSGSAAIAWLASDDRSVAGVVRRDRDGHEISYSWGAYRGGEYLDHWRRPEERIRGTGGMHPMHVKSTQKHELP